MPRTALVTGANRGIGLEICRQLLARDHRVVLTARDRALGEQAAGELSGDGVRVEQLDVADPDSVAACARRLAGDGVEVDVLVNNAGLYTTTPLLRIDEADLVDALEVNLMGAWRTCRTWVRPMRERGWGRVVNVSTGLARFTFEPPSAGAYSLAKTALNVLTRIVATEAGPHVLVNCMSPGWVATRMGGAGAPTSVEDGADTAVWLATLPDNGPTDGFFYKRRLIDW